MNNFSRILCVLMVCFSCAAAVAEERIIGTIVADVDGVQKTWHLLYGEIDATHSAVWMA